MKHDEEVVILFTSDLHGTMTDHDLPDGLQGGLARLRTAIDTIRNEHEHVILIDNGDLLQGTAAAHHGYSHPSAPHPLMAIINDCQYDLLVIGNHDLDFGRQGLEQTARDAAMPLLAANLLKKTSHEPAFGPGYIIHSFSKMNVAIIGLTSTILADTASVDAMDGLYVNDPVKTLTTIMPKVKEQKPDIILVSYHGGLETDPGTGERISGMAGENQGLALLQACPDVDILLSGHQHLILNETTSSNQIILQPGHKGLCLGKVTLKRDNVLSDAIVKQGEIITADHYSPHPDTISVYDNIKASMEDELSTPIIQLTSPLDVSDPMKDVWLSNHPLIEAIHQALHEVTGVDITTTPFLYNDIFFIRKTLSPRDVHMLYPYPNKLVILSLTGREIKEALEHGATFFDRCGSAITIHPAWESHGFHYELWAGIDYDLDLNMSPGFRVREVRYQEMPIHGHDRFQVATTRYRAGGAGGYSMFHPGQIISSFSEPVPDLLIRVWSGWKSFPDTARQNWRLIY